MCACFKSTKKTKRKDSICVCACLSAVVATGSCVLIIRCQERKPYAWALVNPGLLEATMPPASTHTHASPYYTPPTHTSIPPSPPRLRGTCAPPAPGWASRRSGPAPVCRVVCRTQRTPEMRAAACVCVRMCLCVCSRACRCACGRQALGGGSVGTSQVAACAAVCTSCPCPALGPTWSLPHVPLSLSLSPSPSPSPWSWTISPPPQG